jgi:hypothetical protein
VFDLQKIVHGTRISHPDFLVSQDAKCGLRCCVINEPGLRFQGFFGFLVDVREENRSDNELIIIHIASPFDCASLTEKEKKEEKKRTRTVLDVVRTKPIPCNGLPNAGVLSAGWGRTAVSTTDDREQVNKSCLTLQSLPLQSLVEQRSIIE